jgi:hypothetical protein
MAKGRAVAIVLEAEEKSELMALARKHGARRCGPAKLNGARMITSGTERHLCSRHST